ncbi:MAG: indolepyruvate ferredoxin oxidoreductase subunit alpha [Candidatus Caldatribacterium sp.]|nr:indolepyruvate ferredoxin oxidoreductase subunit alpha [Candidatus Caldatribacterium sp.]
MLGNEAFARGAYEGGVEVAAGYPGTPSTEILEFLSTYRDVHSRWCPNEKVAFEVAAGAAIGGRRALATMKHVGLNVASDALMTLAYTGVNAGFVAIVADDPEMHSSQNEQDTRNYAFFAKVPCLEPSNPSEALEFTRLAFAISEQFDTPVLVRSTTRVSHSRGLVKLGERKRVAPKEYRKCAEKFVMIPAFARERRKVLEERLQALEGFAEETPLNRVELRNRRIGIITGGVLYAYLREIAPEVSVLKLGMSFPLPKRKIQEFASQVEELFVLEELDPIWEREIKAMGIKVKGREVFPGIGEITPDVLIERLFPEKKRDFVDLSSLLIPRPPILCAGCPHRGIFKVLRDMKAVVCGDIGCYTLSTLPPLSAMDTCLCMGASISIAEGIKLAHPELFVVAALGDSTFIHAGIPPLIDVVYNKTPIVVLVLDNGTTAMTGGQDHPATGRTLMGEETHHLDIAHLARAVGVPFVETLNAYDPKKIRRTLEQARELSEPALLVIQGPCQLKKPKQSLSRFRVQEDRCRGCFICVSAGCPALVKNEKKVAIVHERCNACGLCMELCPFEAIEEEKV